MLANGEALVLICVVVPYLCAWSVAPNCISSLLDLISTRVRLGNDESIRFTVRRAMAPEWHKSVMRVETEVARILLMLVATVREPSLQVMSWISRYGTRTA
jgi:hypothetical protein